MEVTVLEHCEDWAVDEAAISQIIESVFDHLAEDKSRAVAVVLSDDDEIRQLNRDYRGKDKPTNVLSFPSDEPDEWGDVLFAYSTVAREAQEQNKSFVAHFTHLLVHGTLHLLGYDHMEDKEAEEMESLEIEILAKLAIANPYI